MAGHHSSSAPRHYSSHERNPSLKAKFDEAISHAYGNAIIGAVVEIGLSEDAFPATCPWGFGEMMAEDVWPAF